MNNMKVKIEADATGFDKSINSAEKGLENFDKAADEAGKSLYDLRKAELATKNEIQELNKKITEAKLAKLGEDADKAGGGFLKLSNSITSCIPGFDAFKSKAQTAFAALKDIPNVLKGVSSGAAGAASGLGMLASPIGLVAAAGAAVVGLGAAAAKAGSEFDTNMSQLKAITGATGKDLELLRDKSKELAKVSGQSAGEIANSFTTIGSQMPALLKTSDALALVGENAMVLAQAGSMSADEAASAISTIINQYLVGMDKLDPKEKAQDIAAATDDIINVLALAQLAGSASIEYLSNAMARSGVAATNSKIGYRELAAVIETLAPVSTSAETATTGLNTVLNKLEMQANNKIKPSVVGLQEALKNLGEMKLDTAGFKDMFGDVGAKTAQLLVLMQDLLKAFNETLNDTEQLEGAAAKQAAVMADNIEGDIKKLSGAWKDLLLQLYDSDAFQAIGAAIRPIIQGMTDLISLISDAIVKFNSMSAVVTICEAIGMAIKNSFDAALSAIKIVIETFNIVSSVIETIITLFVNLGKAAYNAVKDCMLFQAVLKVFEWVVDAVRIAYNKIREFFEGILNWYNKIRKELGLKPIEIGFKTKDLGGDKAGGNANIPDAASSNFGTGGTGGGSKTTTKAPKVKTPTATKAPKTDPEKDSIGWYELEVSRISAMIKNTPSLVTAEDKKNLEDYTKKLEDYKNALTKENIIKAAQNIKGPEAGVSYSNNDIKENTLKLKALLDIETDPAEREKIQANIDSWDLLLKLLTDPNALNEFQEAFEKASLDLDEKINESLRETYDGVKTLIGGAENLYNTWSGLNEVMANDDMTAVEKIFAVADAITSTIDTFIGFFDLINNIVNAFKAIGKAANIAKQAEAGVAAATKASTAAKTADLAITQLETAANITGTVAAEGKAMAEGTASGASLPFPANIAAIAAIVASIVGVIATIASLSAPSYATGGIAGGVIQGNGLTNGDRVNIRVNQGEMILNSSQLAKLWRAIQNGNLGASSPLMNGEVRFEIEGDSLIGILNNYNKIYDRS